MLGLESGGTFEFSRAGEQIGLIMTFFTAWLRYFLLGVLLTAVFVYFRTAEESDARARRAELDRARFDRRWPRRGCRCCRRRSSRISCSTRWPTCGGCTRPTAPPARAMLENLMRYLDSRAAADARAPTRRWAASSALAEAYLNVQQIRMGRRLGVRDRRARVAARRALPPMMLLTLVENAIKHGLNPLPEGGSHSHQRARRDGARLRVRWPTTGTASRESSGGGTGLANIRARLAARLWRRREPRAGLNGRAASLRPSTLPTRLRIGPRLRHDSAVSARSIRRQVADAARGARCVARHHVRRSSGHALRQRLLCLSRDPAVRASAADSGRQPSLAAGLLVQLFVLDQISAFALLLAVIVADRVTRGGSGAGPSTLRRCSPAARWAPGIVALKWVWQHVRLGADNLTWSTADTGVTFASDHTLDDLLRVAGVRRRGCSSTSTGAPRGMAADRMRAAELERVRDRQRALESRLQAMQARVEPQFLFNTLAQVERPLRADPKLAERDARRSDRLLARSDAEDARYASTLGQEIELARAYLDIVKVRLGDRLTFEIEVSERRRATPHAADDAAAADRPCGRAWPRGQAAGKSTDPNRLRDCRRQAASHGRR